MKNDTVHYLTSIINLLKKTPQVREIIDTEGFVQELNFGQIGISDTVAFLKLYDILKSIDGVETTDMSRVVTDAYKQYSFRLVTPVSLCFFNCEDVSE